MRTHPFPCVTVNLFPMLRNGEARPHKLSGAVCIARRMCEDECNGRLYVMMRNKHNTLGPADRLCIAKSVALTSIVNDNRETRAYQEIGF